MLRILFHDINFVPGLSRTIYLAKIKHWQLKGVKIGIVCTLVGENFYRQHLQDVDFYALDFKYKITGVYSLIWQVIKINFLALFLLKKIKGKFDIVYSASSVIDFVFIPWAFKNIDSHVKWYVVVDNLVPPPHLRPGSWLRNLIPYLAFLLGNLMLKKADGIFILTDFLKKYYQKRGVKNVVKTGDTMGIEKEIFQGTIPIGTIKVNALYCGRLHLAKGIFDLIDVVKLIVKQKPNFRIGVLGDGEENFKKKFYARIKKEGLENNFYHLGYQTGKKKGDILRLSDFFMFLSYDEGFPHAVTEALACNKPVVAYNLPIYNEVFINYLETGQMVLFPLGDFQAIADFILKTNFSKLHFNNQLEDYSWEKLAENELRIMKL